MLTKRLDPKQPYEEDDICFEFGNRCTALSSIDAVVVTDTDDDDADVTDTVYDANASDVDGTDAYVRVRAGETGHTYLVTCRVITSNGRKLENEAYLPVQERP
jgi:adenylate cyclase class IV